MSYTQSGNEIQSSGQPVAGSKDAFGHLRYPVYPAGSFLTLFFRYIIVLGVFICVGILHDTLSVFFTLHDVTEGIFSLVTMVLAVISLCYWAYLLYRSWAIIQDGDRVATTPGLAVWLNFIPLFNCYWAFVSQLGLAKGMNIYCRQRNIHAPVVNENIAIIDSCMTTIGTAWGMTMCAAAVVCGLADAGVLVLNPMSVWLIYICSCFINDCFYLIFFALEYILYNQYAHVAEAIQAYKLSQDAAIERQ